MFEFSTVGVDLAKNVIQVHGVDADGKTVLRRQLRRNQFLSFFEGRPGCLIGMEACSGAHHWGRRLQEMGHEVRLMPPSYVKPYVKRGKNDAADAEALCEAVSRPTMRFVPVKTAEQQAALMLVGVRERLIQKRTQLVNAIRGYGAEFGITAATGACRVVPLLECIAEDETIPELARELFVLQGKEYAQLQCEIERIDAKLMEWHRNDECSQRLAKIPGVGPIGATLLMMKTPDPHLFKSGRDFAAWMGLTPKDHSTAGKTRHGVITRAGDELLRSTLVVGATAVVQHARNGRGRNLTPWLIGLIARKSPKLVAVAVANKAARVAWKLMVSGERYQCVAPPALTAVAA